MAHSSVRRAKARAKKQAQKKAAKRAESVATSQTNSPDKALHALRKRHDSGYAEPNLDDISKTLQNLHDKVKAVDYREHVDAAMLDEEDLSSASNREPLAISLLDCQGFPGPYREPESFYSDSSDESTSDDRAMRVVSDMSVGLPPSYPKPKARQVASMRLTRLPRHPVVLRKSIEAYVREACAKLPGNNAESASVGRTVVEDVSGEQSEAYVSHPLNLLVMNGRAQLQNRNFRVLRKKIGFAVS